MPFEAFFLLLYHLHSFSSLYPISLFLHLSSFVTNKKKRNNGSETNLVIDLLSCKQ